MENLLKGYDLPPQARKCEQTSHRLLDLFLKKLKEAEEETGHPLSYERAKKIAENLKRGGSSAKSELALNFATCRQDLEAQLRIERRGNPLGRLLIEQLSILFPLEGEPSTGSRLVSRQIINPFLALLEEAVGEAFYQERNQAALSLVKDLAHEGDKMAVWRRFFAHNHSQQLLIDVLFQLAEWFAEFETQKASFIEEMNRRLGDSAGGFAEPRPSWSMKEQHFRNIMSTLYLHADFSLCELHPDGRENCCSPERMTLITNFVRNLQTGQSEKSRLSH
jgi:hypothetical protein